MINEARVTLSLDDVYIPVNTALNGFNRGVFGINYPYLMPNGKDLPNKIPTVTIPNFSSLSGGPYPSHSSGPIWTAGDTLTKIVGNHTLKFGYNMEYSGENDGDEINVSTVPGGASNQNGTFTFTDARTGLGATSGIGVANMALGLADAYTEIGPRSLTILRGWMHEAFAQDSWKVSRQTAYRVTDSAGPRYRDFTLSGEITITSMALYIIRALPRRSSPTTGNVILGTGNPYDGVVIPGLSGFPSSAVGRVLPATPATANACDGASCAGLFAPSLPRNYIGNSNDFQPRLGVAYRINDKTVVRAGIGNFATRMGLLDNIFPGGNSPFQPFITVNNVSVDNPPASVTAGTAAPATITTLNPHLKAPAGLELECYGGAATPAEKPADGCLRGAPRYARMAGL